MANEDLSTQLVKAMRQYSDEAKASIYTALQGVADQALERVKAGSPGRSGKYKKGWKVVQTKDAATVGFEIRQKGKERASLTHLLEHGHRKRNRQGWVQAQPHIQAVQDWAARAAEEAIRKAVQG